MAFLSASELLKIPFKKLGINVKISDKVSIYEPEKIEIGDYSRIDDFSVISGKIKIGSFVHLAVFSNLAGGSEGIVLDDFSGLAYGCHVFSQSDDYSGHSLTNPTVPDKYKKETKKMVYIGKHCIVGTSSVIFPGVHLAEGTAVGAGAVVTKSTQEWSIYVGNPAKKIKNRSKELLKLEQDFLAELNNIEKE
ncbi:MAG: acyltransferase [Woronichinia naegeliana WA131]|jgi:acetyltransferase-like isoleucine patch superfamily enzyme|uniref:Acyltransferase n=1 Tax=Woronichinia naegeliana WA131 TaxID=2824559 RepID=A0A977PX10_9CYAN|nr:MAG: acyltransferase [Woronichinia naegeliana WA131]